MEKESCFKAVVNQIKMLFGATHHSSSRYSPYGRMRDIVVGYVNAPLYPGLQISGMTNGASGFTLIELLVVVLIIGILAAVALPQYQQAVSKSRSMEAISLIRSFVPALQSYMLANNQFPTTWLDLDFSADGSLGKYQVDNDTLYSGTYRYILTKGRLDADQNPDAPSFLWISDMATAFTELEPNHMYCYYEKRVAKPRLEKVCASFGTRVDLSQYPNTFFYKMN